MESIKRKAKRITSIILIITILVGVLPNFGLLKESKAASGDEFKGIVINKGNYDEENKVFSVELYIKNLDVTAVDMTFCYPSNIIETINYIKYENGIIEPNTSSNKAIEVNEEINFGIDIAKINVDKGNINVFFNGECYASNTAIMIARIYFHIKEDTISIDDITNKMFRILNTKDDPNMYFGIVTDDSPEGEYSNEFDMFLIEGFKEVPSVQSIAVKTNPTEGQKYTHGNTIDLEGGELTVTYTDGSTKDISMKEEGVIVKTGEQIGAIADINNKQITFEYEEATTQLEVNVIDPIESIEFYDKNNILGTYTIYNNDPILKEELFIKTITKSGNTSEIALSDARITLSSDEADITKVKDAKYNPVNQKSAGIQEIEITYKDEDVEKTTSFNIVVNDIIGEIKISETNAPDAILTVGSDFTKTGAIEIIGRSKVSYGEIPMSSGDVTVTEVDGTKVDLSKPTNVGEKKTLKVTYAGIDTTYEVEVKDTVKEIKVNGIATTKYNEALKASDFNGITVTEIMASGVEGATVPLDFTWVDKTGYNNMIAKQQNLTVNYPNSGKTIKGEVLVQVEDKLLGIRVENLKDEYVYKDELDLTSGELYIIYVSGEIGANLSDFDLSDPDSDLKVTGFDNTTIGEQELTFTYNDGVDEASTKVTVNVGKATLEAPECEQLEIVEGKALSTIADSLPTTEYGDVIWKDGTQTLTYVEGTDNIQEIDATYKMNTANAPYYKDVDCKIKVKVLKREVSKIEITTPPTDVEYVEGQDFDPTGMVITVTYNDGDTATISSDYATKGVTFAPSANLQTTDTQVTVTYSAKTATQDITVVEKKVTSIAVTTAPTKASYIAGQALDLTGMVVKATYNDGDIQETTNYTTNPANGATLNTVGTQTIEVTYTGTDAVAGIATASTSVEVEAKKVTSIAVSTAPTKTSYVEGQALDLTGMVVKATYNDGDEQVTTDYTTSPANGATLSTVGTQKIEVTYTGADAVVGIEKTETSVEVEKKVVQSIAVTTPPTKTSYVEGHPFEAAGMVVTAYYNDGTDAPTTNYTISPSGDLTPANTQITITYNGTDIANGASAPTTNVTITVSERQVESIQITKAPTKVNYIEGQDFDATGMEITVTYNDHEKPLVISSDYATKGVTFAPSTNLQTANDKVVVSYRGFTDNQTITVIPDSVTDITITAPSKKEYNYGDTIDLTNATITKVWASGLTHENDTIPMTKDMLSNADIASFNNMNSLGQKQITVTYGAVVKSNAFQIEIKDYINSIEIEDKTKLQEEYEYGDTINVTDKDTGADLYILAKYAGGTPDKKVKLTTDMVSGFNMSKVQNKQVVTVTYEGKTDTFEINVKDKVIGIDITKEPANKVYKLNESVNFSDIVIKNVMASGAEGTVLTISDYQISTVDTSTKGEKEVTVTKRGTTFTDTFKIKVIDATKDMSITKMPKTSYKYGEALDITEGEITVTTQTDSTVIPMTNLSVKVTGYNANKLGNQTLTVTYTYSEETDNGIETKQKTDTYTVNVEDYATGIAITKNPSKLTYEYGESLDLADGKVAEKMASGATRNEVDITGEMVSGYESTKEGKQTITVTYLGKTATFDITVVDSILGISMNKLPNKTEYTQGESLDVSGAVLNVTKSSGIKEIAVTKEMISGYDPNKVGTQVVTVTYNGFATEFVVVVKAKTVEKPTTPVKPNKPSKPNKPVKPSNPTTPVTPSEPSTSEVVKYTVTFINYDGTILKIEEVESGKSATAPELEERKGYKFLGWDTEFDIVEEDLNVMAQYEKIEVTTKPSEKPAEVLGVKDEVNSTENDITSTLVPALAGVTVSGLLLLLIAAITKKNVEIYAVSEGERKLLGKEKLTKKCRTVSIDKYKEELGKGSLEVVLNSKISNKLNGENVDIILNNKELTYKVKVNDNEAFVIEIKNK